MRCSRASLAAVFALSASLGCGAKTGVRDDPRDGGSDGAIECAELCPGSTFCEPWCATDAGCFPLPAPSCDDDDDCTRDLCDPDLDTCVNELMLVDEDGDGALAPIECGGTDCNDEDPLVYPGAPERCNGIDDDCDDLIDEGADLVPWEVEVPIAASAQTDDAASLVWTDGEYVYGYWDYVGEDADVYLLRLTLEGEPIEAPLQVTTSAGDGYGPDLVWTGRELAAVWSDRREGNFEIYFARFNSELERLTGDIRVTVDDEWSLYPRVVWSGLEYLVVWQDERTLSFEAYAQRIGPEGLTGDIAMLSSAGSRGETAESPTVAFDGESYHVAWLEGGLESYDVRYSRFDQLLELQGTLVLTEGMVGTSSSPTVTSSPGSAAVAWEQSIGSGFDAMVALVSSDGELRAPPRAINGPDVTARESTLLWDNNGYVAVASVFDASFDLAFAVIDPDGGEAQPLSTFVRSRGDAVSAVVALGPGEIGVGWSDTRSGTYDAYFTRLLCAGL